MPLQKWMTEHGHPGWYSWLVVIGGAFTSMLVAVGISVTLNRQAIQREEEQDRQNAALVAVEQEKGREATCLVIRRMTDAYEDPPPVTETGRKAGVAWRELGRTFGCKE